MNIEIEKLLVWDIETIPMENFSEESPFFDTWQNKKRKEDFSSEELIDLFNKEGGLYSEYLRIVCISCAYIHNGKIRLKSFTGEEKDIIDEFIKVASFVNSSYGGVINVGHNITDFDIPSLRTCYSRYYPMFTLPDYISDLNTKGKLPVKEKPWVLEERMLDTLKISKGSKYMFSSMAEVALNLGIPSPKLDTDGSKVAELYRNREIGKIATYCEGDVITSLKILFSWMGQEMLPVVRVESEPKQEKLPVLKRIRNFDEITPDIEKELLEILSGKVEEKELIYIEELLKAALFRDDFISGDQDSKDVREQKEETIKLLLEDLKN